MTDYNDLSAKDLRTELRQRDLPVSGNKTTMVKRLVTADAELGTEDEEFDPDQLFGDNVLRFEAAVDKLCDALEISGTAMGTVKAAIIPNAVPDEAPVPEGVRSAAAELVAAAEEQLAATRESIREATRKLLTTQPDGRQRALRVLGEYGGSVSAVPENDLGRCLSALTNELEQING